ncbi:MAG: universal stress protein [Solirubrobacterales bacterium]|nr:universal stress protein [Solirubrobacterales bacterium]
MSLLHLVGHDGTSHGDDALALARAVGTGRDVRRTVLHILAFGGPTEVADPDWLAKLPAKTQGEIRCVREAVHADETLEVVIASSPARGLHDRAEELAADLVVVGSRTRQPLGRELTPVANRLLSGGPCAVLHAPAGWAVHAGPLARIVVGYDRSPEAGDALAEAAAIAAASGARVDVVHAHEETGVYLGYPGAVYVTPEEIELADEQAAQTAAEGLAELPEALRGISAARHGTPGAVVDAFAIEREADLIVLGSRGYGPVRRTLLGSASGHLLRHAGRPVLVLPRGSHATVPATAPGLAVAR